MAFWDEELLNLEYLSVYKSRCGRSGNTDIVGVGTNPDTIGVIKAFRAGIRDFVVRPLTKANVTPILEACHRFRRRSGSCLASRLEKYLETSFQDPELTMTSVAKRFGISTDYVGRLYREEIGVTFRNRLLDERVRKAQRLLSETRLNITEISDMCGFRQPSRLSEAFSSRCGMSPRQFRYTIVDDK